MTFSGAYVESIPSTSTPPSVIGDMPNSARISDDLPEPALPHSPIYANICTLKFANAFITFRKLHTFKKLDILLLLLH